MKQKLNRVKKFAQDHKTSLTIIGTAIVTINAVYFVEGCKEGYREGQAEAEEAKRIITEMWDTHPAVIAANEQ